MRVKRGNRFLIPVVLLLLVATPFLMWDELAYLFGLDLLEQSAVVMRYLLGVFVWMLLAYTVNRIIEALIWVGLFEQRLDRPVPKLLRDMVALLVYVAAIAGIIGVVFQRSLTLLAAATGGVGFVIGLAIRDMIADVFSGLALSIEHPFRIGDYIRLDSGEEGEVVGMSWRATHVRTTDNDIVIIPNNVVASRAVTNYHGAGSHFRVDIEFWLAFDVDPERALRILNAAVKNVQNQVPEVATEYPDPITGEDLESDAVAVDISEFGIKYRVRFWLLRYTNWSVTRNAIITSVMEHLKRAGITPAYPQQDLYISRMPERSRDEETLRMEMLSKIGIFGGLTDDELRDLARKISRRLAHRGETVIQRGDPGNSMYLIAEGLVNVLIWVEAQQQEVKVAHMVSGQFFGEMALLTGEPRSATIQAGMDTVLYEVTRDHLMDLVQSRPEIAEEMTRVITEHKVRDSQNIEMLTPEEQEAEQENLVSQMLGKVRSLFGLG